MEDKDRQLSPELRELIEKGFTEKQAVRLIFKRAKFVREGRRPEDQRATTPEAEIARRALQYKDEILGDIRELLKNPDVQVSYVNSYGHLVKDIPDALNPLEAWTVFEKQVNPRFNLQDSYTEEGAARIESCQARLEVFRELGIDVVEESGYQRVSPKKPWTAVTHHRHHRDKNIFHLITPVRAGELSQDRQVFLVRTLRPRPNKTYTAHEQLAVAKNQDSLINYLQPS